VPSKRMGTKRGSRIKTREFTSRTRPVFTLGRAIKTTKSRKRPKGFQLVTLWGGENDISTSVPQIDNTRLKRIRNPWVPDDIVQLLKFLSLSYPVSKAFVESVKAWMQSRGAEEVTIEAGGKKLTIKGHMSQPRIKKILDEFAKRIDGSVHDDIKVSLPKGVKRSIPREFTTMRKESKK
jgi:hypothetical protein